jgi:hypothetical protein
MFANVAMAAKELQELLHLKSHVIILDYLNPGNLNPPSTGNDPFTPEQEKEWRQRLLISLDLVASLGDFTFLCTQLSQLASIFGQTEYLWESLEPYILNKKIKWLSPKFMKDLCEHYSKTKKLHYIEFLLLNLPAKAEGCPPMESDVIIRLCIDFRLFLALINLCVKCEDDFITPLVMLFSIYRKSVDEGHPDREIGRICHIYVENCIRGIFYPDQIFPEKLHQDVVKRLTEWLMAKDNFTMFMEIDVYLGIHLFLMLVLSQPSSSILMKSTELNIHGSPATLVRLIEPQAINKVRPDAPSLDVHTPSSATGVNSPPQSRAMSYETIYLYQNNLTKVLDHILDHLEISAMFREEDSQLMVPEDKRVFDRNLSNKRWCCIYLIQKVIESHLFAIRADLLYKIILFELVNHSSATKFQGEDAPSLFKGWDEEQIMYYIGINAMKLLKHCGKDLGSDHVEKLTTAASLSPFTNVYAYIIELKGDYKHCIDIFLSARSIFDQERVFDFVEDMLKSVASKTDAKTIQKTVLTHILSKLKEFVVISAERTQKLVAHFSRESEREVVHSLSNYPDLQLDYLDKMLNDKDREAKVDDELLLLHLELLCKFRKKHIPRDVAQFNYPISLSLKICREYDALNGEAFFLEKISDYQNALEIHLKV